MALVVIAQLVALSAWAWVVFVFQPFGHRHGIMTAIALALVCLVAGLRRGCKLATASASEARRIMRRPFRPAAWVSATALACWFGLIAWSAVRSGGALPSPKSNAGAIRVVTWNILHGSDTGWPWRRCGWPVRKKSIQLALAGMRPDILCVQEALEEQSAFLAEIMPGHSRVGVGRDDGRTQGEECTIFFDRARFEELGGDTFWLEEPTDRPAAEWRLGPKRICTWVRLRDRESGQAFRIYNTHQYLTESARLSAVRIILAKIDSGDPTDAILVAGDFNARPDTPDRRLFEAVGLLSRRSSLALTANWRRTSFMASAYAGSMIFLSIAAGAWRAAMLST